MVFAQAVQMTARAEPVSLKTTSTISGGLDGLAVMVLVLDQEDLADL